MSLGRRRTRCLHIRPERYKNKKLNAPRQRRAPGREAKPYYVFFIIFHSSLTNEDEHHNITIIFLSTLAQIELRYKAFYQVKESV